jgi:SnoaL-like domain
MTTASIALPACLQVTHQLFYFLDESRYRELAGLFAPDGRWQRQGELLVGRDQILQAMLKRPATQRTRHVITNGFIESQSDARVHLVAYMVAYRFDDGQTHAGPVQISRPFRMSVVRAVMRQAKENWEIADMSFKPEFEFADAQAMPLQPSGAS